MLSFKNKIQIKFILLSKNKTIFKSKTQVRDGYILTSQIEYQGEHLFIY